MRQVEVGLASMTIMFSGLTAMLFAGAFWLSADARKALAWLGAASGVAMVISGIVHAHTGFWEVALLIGMPAELLLLLWVLLIGVFLARDRRHGKA